jgi:endonuclease/exonuclease/phosphatase family metal-dependent hydrolase
MKKFIFILGLFCFAFSSKAQDNSIKVMSFDIYPSNADETQAQQSWKYFADNSVFTERRERVFFVINQFDPDILGVQSINEQQFKEINTNLSKFASVGVPTSSDKSASYNAIYFKTYRFTLEDSGSFWLSETPNLKGTTFIGKGKDMETARNVSWARLNDKLTQQEILVMNTQWSKDDSAKSLSAKLLLDSVQKISNGLPVIVLGSLNCTQNDRPYKILRDLNPLRKFFLGDTYREAFPNLKESESTMHNWTGNIVGQRMDFVLYTEDWFNTIQANIDRYADAMNFYPSNHFPVNAILGFKSSDKLQAERGEIFFGVKSNEGTIEIDADGEGFSYEMYNEIGELVYKSYNPIIETKYFKKGSYTVKPAKSGMKATPRKVYIN